MALPAGIVGRGLPRWLGGKESAYQRRGRRRCGFHPWVGDPWRRKWQYSKNIPRIPSNSCLKNPMDRRAWQVTVHGVAESWTRLSIHTCCGEGLAVTLGAHEVGPHSIQTQKFIYVKPCSLAITL